MFRRSKPLFLDYSSSRRRSRWRPPGWLLLLAFGILAGVVGVLYVQDRYLPERLTPAASAELRHAFDEASAARDKLRTELDAATRQLHAAQSERQTAATELEQTKSSLAALKRDLGSVVASLPPDPRGGTVEIRAGWFSSQDGNVSYNLVLTRNSASGAGPLPASLQITVAGEDSGAPRSIAAKAQPVTVENMQILRGSFSLPKDFKPAQATVQVMDRASSRQLGMRVLLVK